MYLRTLSRFIGPRNYFLIASARPTLPLGGMMPIAAQTVAAMSLGPHSSVYFPGSIQRPANISGTARS